MGSENNGNGTYKMSNVSAGIDLIKTKEVVDALTSAVCIYIYIYINM